jgi:hypothetical protein
MLLQTESAAKAAGDCSTLQLALQSDTLHHIYKMQCCIYLQSSTEKLCTSYYYYRNTGQLLYRLQSDHRNNLHVNSQHKQWRHHHIYSQTPSANIRKLSKRNRVRRNSKSTPVRGK